MSALKERRSKKIKDFVLVGDEEENTEAEVAEEKENEEIDDFKSLEDAPDIESISPSRKAVWQADWLCCSSAS